MPTWHSGANPFFKAAPDDVPARSHRIRKRCQTPSYRGRGQPEAEELDHVRPIAFRHCGRERTGCPCEQPDERGLRPPVQGVCPVSSP